VKRSQHETGLGFGLRLETPAWWWWLGVAISAWWWLGLADLADLGLGLPISASACLLSSSSFPA